jgi:hypothetical protein
MTNLQQSAQHCLPTLLNTRWLASSRFLWGVMVLLAGVATSTPAFVPAQDQDTDRRPTQRQTAVRAILPPAVPPPTKAESDDAPAPLRTHEVRVINARTGRPEPGVTVRSAG